MLNRLSIELQSKTTVAVYRFVENGMSPDSRLTVTKVDLPMAPPSPFNNCVMYIAIGGVVVDTSFIESSEMNKSWNSMLDALINDVSARLIFRSWNQELHRKEDAASNSR